MAQAEIWKTEYHVLDASGDAVDWLADKAEAIAKAQAMGGKVEAVTSFFDRRAEVWPMDETNA